jgi:tetratricopeptide (TPR) repeat protein
LHRLRALVAGWGDAATWQAERSRVMLSVPTDVARLVAHATGLPAAVLLETLPAHWLQGFRLPGFDEFWAWSDGQRRQLQAAWCQAAEPALVQALRAGEGDQALALHQAWVAARAADGDGPPPLAALRALQGANLPASAQPAWQRLRGSGPVPVTGWLAPAGTTGLLPMQALAGRGDEQAALRACSLPAAVLLGEAGAGKSTVLAAALPGVPCLHGREGLSGMPFRAVLEWLHQHLDSVRAALARPDTGLQAYRLDLARLLPELAPDEPLPPLDAHTAKARLLEALARVFEAQGPLLAVDDLQWLDAATLEWLVWLAHRGRLQWRAAARRHELAGAARQALDSLTAAHLLQQQLLPLLNRDALAQVCTARWPQRAWDDQTLDRLHKACAGNAFVLGELVAAGAPDLGTEPGAAEPLALPRRVQALLQRRLQTLGPLAQRWVEAAAVLGQPVPAAVLAGLTGTVAELAGEPDQPQGLLACEEALAAGLLCEVPGGLQCGHDLIRSAVLAGLGTTRGQWLHRRAALALAARPGLDEPLVIAEHWQRADELQTALAWMHRGAAQQKLRGRFDDARALWQRVAQDSLDATQSLRAQLALAECELFGDLSAGRVALEAVLDQLGAVADDLARDQIEGHTLAGLVDNAVFAGDMHRARQQAGRLRALLPRLRTDERIQALQVLIELAMREPDLDAARTWLGQLQRLAPRHPETLSFAAQIDWVSGRLPAARDGFEAMLAQHASYCSGLTIENDLAVVLLALGELARAEDMARRSLRSWAGVPHTEALSRLVLGSVLTSAGRCAQAEQVLHEALALARSQASALFEAEAQVRLARLALLCGRLQEAGDALDAAASQQPACTDPLRLSAWVLTQVMWAVAAQQPVPDAPLARLRMLSLQSVHPLVHARLARIDATLALAAGDAPRAQQAAERQVAIARQASLAEWLAEGLMLQVRAGELAGQPMPDLLPCAQEAAGLAQAQGLADVAWRAQHWLAQVAHQGATAAAAARAALRQLQADLPPGRFVLADAARREPRCP